MAEMGESFLLALPELFLIFYSFIGEIEPNTLLESHAQHHRNRVLSAKANKCLREIAKEMWCRLVRHHEHS
jgi:hypothetical protein